MAISIALIIIFGLLSNFLFTKIKLPGLLGMILAGILLGPFSLNLLDELILDASSDLRMIALVIILLRAGLAIKTDEIKKVGRVAILMSFIPGILEAIAILFFSIILFQFNYIEGGMLGFILAAVSPAVVVPLMLKYIEEKKGEKKGLPILILSAASLDDVFAITFFMIFVGIYTNQNYAIGIQLLNIPISIILGALLGLIIGVILVIIFKKIHIRDTKKVIIIIALAIIMLYIEDLLASFILISALLGVMVLGITITRLYPNLGNRLSIKFNKVWVFAEIFLFCLLGASVDVNVAINAGLLGVGLILIGLIFRSIGVLLTTIKANYNYKEKIFLVVSYLPKATVQAAIGSIPLSLGVPFGEVILAISVLAILITAPLGAVLINTFGEKLLMEEVNIS